MPKEVLVLTGAGRAGGRDVFATDPVRAAVQSGKWLPPKAGDKVSGERERTWTAVKMKNGSPDSPTATGYVYAAIESADDRVAILEAAGHGMVFVNGEPRMGDIYRTGYVRMPVQLKKGANHFLFAPGRGVVNFKFAEPKNLAEFSLGDVTMPDLVVGQPTQTELAVVVLNNTNAVANQLEIESKLPNGEAIRNPVPSIPPLGVRKVGVQLVGSAPDKTGPLACSLTLLRDKQPLETATLNVNSVAATSTRKQTFRSTIDGSVQYYGWVPAAADKDEKRQPGLILALHGASVEGIGHAACFTPKAGLHVVSPTNRRPYGFDWEDWGRLDAVEVLDYTSKLLKTDPKRTYLTGHSMGGHGTWHLGVTYPDRFAAIGPSAGWVSLSSYGGLRRDEKPLPEREIVFRASAPSNTLSLAHNLLHTGVYILHGDADDNVPVTQARTMRAELATFHPDFAYYEQHGAGHWWGNACADWQPMTQFFQRHMLPEISAVRDVDFRTAQPSVSSHCHWLTIEAQQKSFIVSRANIQHDAAKRTFTGKTENIARLSLDVTHLQAKKEPLSITLDGTKLANVTMPEKGNRIWLTRTGETWAVTAEPSLDLKGPHRAGPFRDVFRSRMIFVYGTNGTPDENAWALAKARFDAEQFWYRGNGSIDVISDREFDGSKEADRNVVLYGHADMNSAYSALLGDAKISVRRGKITAGSLTETGDDLALLLAFPRPKSNVATVGVVAGSGLHGMRLTDRLSYFSSGVAYPDWTILDPNGVRGAGYFGNDWQIETGETAWKK